MINNNQSSISYNKYPFDNGGEITDFQFVFKSQ